jgi:hypothetical protein
MLASKWQNASDKEIRFLAARNGLQLWFWGVALLGMLVVGCAYEGYLGKVLSWLVQFPRP